VAEGEVRNPSSILKVLELKLEREWWFAVLRPEENFVNGSFDTEITLWSDTDAPNPSPLEGEMYGIDNNTRARQLYALLYSRRFGQKYVQRLVELMEVA
jgi:hypothetical protein